MISDRYVFFVFVQYIFYFISIFLLTRLKFTDTDLFLSRVSIAVVRTGSTAGDTGPTIIFIKGEKKRPKFTEKLLKKHRILLGSTIAVTTNAYMTDKSCVLVFKSVVKGYRSMTFVYDNPQWMMLNLLGGFGFHAIVL